MDDADHVGFSVTDGKMLWPVPTELKISKPDLVAKSDTNSQKKLQWAFELAKERPQALAALQRILPPNYTDTPWVYNLAATSGPIFEITRNGTSYLTGEVCKPHDCRDNLFGFIVAGNGSRAVAATRISGKQSLYGQPTPAEINVLTNLIDWAYDGGNNTSPAQQQTVLQQIIEGLPPQPVQALPPQQTQGAPLSGQMTCINGYQDYFWYTATMSMAEAQQNLSNRASTISFLNDVRNRGKAFCARERASGRCCGPSAYPNNIRIQVNANNIIQLVATGDLIGDWNIDNAFDRVIQSPPAVSQSGEPWPNSAGFAEQSNGDAPTEAEATQCVRAALASANQCSGFLTIDGIRQIDRRADQGSAEVIMEVDFTVAKSFEACSPIAAACTGTCWKQNTNVQYQTSNFGVGENYFKVGARLRSHKSFIFQKFESGWRCQTKTLQPVSESFFLN